MVLKTEGNIGNDYIIEYETEWIEIRETTYRLSQAYSQGTSIFRAIGRHIDLTLCEIYSMLIYLFIHI